MKALLIPAGLALALVAGTAAAPAQASGCLKGAAIGGVAGHFAVTTASSGPVSAA